MATCVNDETQGSCSALFNLANPPAGSKPENTWRAIVNIAHYPAQNVSELFDLSLDSTVYEPALDSSMVPDAWTLAVRFDAGGTLDGPGAFAIDAQGNVWVNNNYIDATDPTLACGDDHVFKLNPDGSVFPGSPFGGIEGNGGLYGSGFGIAMDPFGYVWASNFGFQGTQCFIGPDEQALLSSSVSQFDYFGNAVSPSRPPQPYGGWHDTISQPQGVTTDQAGNIWIANCGNASVTKS